VCRASFPHIHVFCYLIFLGNNRRLVGRNFTDIQSDNKPVPFSLIERRGQALIQVEVGRNLQKLTPDYLYGLVLAKVKETVDEYLSADVTCAILTVPSIYAEDRRQSLKDIAATAGLKVSRVVSTPVAAGIGQKLTSFDERYVLVFDIGDPTDAHMHIMEIDSGVFDPLSAVTGIQLEYEPTSDYGRVDKAVSATIDAMRHVFKNTRLTREMIDDLILIGPSNHMPAIQALLEEKLGIKAMNTTKMEDAAAIGALMQAAIVYRTCPSAYDSFFVEINPLTLGIKTAGGVMHPMVRRNLIVPVRKVQRFTTEFDNQTSVLIRIFQAERPLVKNNIFLREFELEISPAPRGVPRIDVIFEVDADNNLKVIAWDVDMGRGESIFIEPGDGLDHDTIADLVFAAEFFQPQDDVFRELIPRTYRLGGRVLKQDIDSKSSEKARGENSEEL
jgi:molecular chaperone DnaK (HSP70)